ncbi:hypothetical protein B0O99DRAFT_693313 [Bisporella sp. PMI_857]|nr:hypothetical protein B0O99DRAFT_693313 [Bisporella sp. PMI_857]
MPLPTLEDYDYDDESDEDDRTNSRYEMELWWYHYCEADKLLTSDKKHSGSDWKAFTMEVNNFVGNASGSEPLHVAAFFGLVNLAEDLLSQDASVDAVFPSGFTPLHFITGCEVGHNVMYYFALYGGGPLILDPPMDNEEYPSNKASINIEDGYDEAPLHKLMSRIKFLVEILRAFLKRGADVDAEDKDSEGPLYEVAFRETCRLK